MNAQAPEEWVLAASPTLHKGALKTYRSQALNIQLQTSPISAPCLNIQHKEPHSCALE